MAGGQWSTPLLAAPLLHTRGRGTSGQRSCLNGRCLTTLLYPVLDSPELFSLALIHHPVTESSLAKNANVKDCIVWINNNEQENDTIDIQCHFYNATEGQGL